MLNQFSKISISNTDKQFVFTYPLKNSDLNIIILIFLHFTVEQIVKGFSLTVEAFLDHF